jgi:hypothetical protein
MTGLLHRLAAAATGKSMLVRSNARLPVNDAAPAWTDVADALPVPRPPARHPAPTEPPPGADSLSASPRPEQARQGPAIEASLETAAVAQAERGEDALRLEPPAPLLPVRLALAPIEAAAAPAPPQLRTAARNPPDQEEPGSAAAPADRALRTTSMLERVEPPALLPRAATRSAPAEQFRTSESSDADDGTEVHIHIGRIEVTAVQAPPPRRKSPSMPPPMSLDEYLVKRGRT